MRSFPFIAWLITGLIVFVLLMLGGGVSLAIAGLLLIGWGSVVGSNYRGVADAMPTRMGIGPVWQETSPAMIRAVFACFGLIGLLFLIAGLSSAR